MAMATMNRALETTFAQKLKSASPSLNHKFKGCPSSDRLLSIIKMTANFYFIIIEAISIQLLF